MPDKVAAIIVNYGTPDLTIACLHALHEERSHLPALRCVVVDGGSPDDSAARLERYLTDPAFGDWVDFLPLPLNGGFGWANNQAILHLCRPPASPDFVYLINPDARVEPGAVGALHRFMLGNPDSAAAGSQLFDLDGRPVGSAFRFPSIGSEFARGSRTAILARLLRIPDIMVRSGDGACEVDWVTGASVMLRVDALRQVGLFDDGFFLYFEEVELMHRLKLAGWKCHHVPASRVTHIGGAATGVDGHGGRRQPAYWYRSRRRYFTRTGGRGYALLASLAWSAGHLIWRLRRAVGLAKGQGFIPNELKDLWSEGLRPDRSDRLARPAWPGDSPGETPSWMRDPA